jgi:hypothetical protein
LHGMVDQIRDFRAPDLALARQAVDVGAGSADPLALYDGSTSPGLRHVPGQVLAAPSTAFRHGHLQLRVSTSGGATLSEAQQHEGDSGRRVTLRAPAAYYRLIVVMCKAASGAARWRSRTTRSRMQPAPLGTTAGAIVPSWSMAPLVAAHQAMRGSWSP